MDSTLLAKRLFIFCVHTVKSPCAYIGGHRKPRGCQCVKANSFAIQTNSVDCVTQFEAAGSAVTVKRSPVSTRVKVRDTARGTDKNICTGQSKPPLERDSV